MEFSAPTKQVKLLLLIIFGCTEFIVDVRTESICLRLLAINSRILTSYYLYRSIQKQPRMMIENGEGASGSQYSEMMNTNWTGTEEQRSQPVSPAPRSPSRLFVVFLSDCVYLYHRSRENLQFLSTKQPRSKHYRFRINERVSKVGSDLQSLHNLLSQNFPYDSDVVNDVSFAAQCFTEYLNTLESPSHNCYSDRLDYSLQQSFELVTVREIKQPSQLTLPL